MKRISIGSIILSLLSIAYSLFISVYIDEEACRKKYMVPNWLEQSSRNASEKFYELRGECFSQKYMFQGYGINFLVLGLATLVFFGKGLPINAPSSNAKVALMIC